MQLRRRTPAGSLALLFGAAWLIAAVHSAAPHVYCAEHQGLEEPPIAARGAAPPRDGAAVSDCLVQGARHEACALVCHRAFARPGQPAPAMALGAARLTLVLAGDQISSPVVPLLANAPKASPPPMSV